MSTYLKLFLWWLCFSSLWGIYRTFHLPEFVSEVVAKPVIWLGITGLFFYFHLIPQAVLTDLKQNHLTTKPMWKTLLFPLFAIAGYFLLINFRQIQLPPFSFSLLFLTIVINFSTGIVEEVVYRGVMYVWLLRHTSEAKAFGIVQVLFLLGHVPTLVLNSASVGEAATHAVFILLGGALHTVFFRLTKSLYASSVTHGTWNSLAHYFLLVH
jgi:membrane protease YdiL (CAAX protease family)